ncbi:hypothetical protein V6N13_002572 [Hibiscus sabdariffa]
MGPWAVPLIALAQRQPCSLVDLGNEFGVPSYVFFASGAGFLGFHLYTEVLHDEQQMKFSELKDSDTEFRIPSYVRPVSIKLFPTHMLQPETFTLSPSNSNHLPSETLTESRRLQQAHQNYDAVMQWLDEQPHFSVVFLCFGSMGSFGADQVKEIAYALEQSGHRFLWSLRQLPEQVKDMVMCSLNDYEVTEVLPEGFLDRTIEMGKIIGWALQAAILSHPATGEGSCLTAVGIQCWRVYGSECQWQHATLRRAAAECIDIGEGVGISGGD